MKRFLLIAMLFAMPLTTYAGSGVSVGVASDYFFRGVSQTDQPHVNLTAIGEWNGFHAGAWVGTVDFGDEADYEYDLFAGYKMNVMDNMSVELGVIQYRYDAGDYDMVEEVFAGLTYGGLSIRGFQDTDTDDTYAELGLDISNIVPVLDVNLLYGYHDEDNDFSALRVGYNNFFAEIMLETVMDGQSMDSISVGYNYHF